MLNRVMKRISGLLLALIMICSMFIPFGNSYANEITKDEKENINSIKLEKGKDQSAEISKIFNEYLDIYNKTQKNSRNSLSAEGEVTEIDLIVVANYKKLPTSKYNLSDYLNDEVNLNLEAIYVGDNQIGDIQFDQDVTDRLTPNTFAINIKDIYGNGGKEGADLFPDPIHIEGYNTIADYLTTNFNVLMDEAAFKKSPSGNTLEAYLNLNLGFKGEVNVPVLELSFEEAPVPDGELGNKSIVKKVLNETEEEQEFKEETNARIGDIVAFEISITNDSNMIQKVSAVDKLNENLKDISLVNNTAYTENEFINEEGTVKINTLISPGEVKNYVFKAVIGENANTSIVNTVEMDILKKFSDQDKLSREDRIKIKDTEDGGRVLVIDTAGNELELVVFNQVAYKQEKVSAEAKVNIVKKGEQTIKEITLVGGKNTLTEKVEDQLKDKFTLNRLAGKDRYATSAQVSRQYGVRDTVLLASGEKYTDELTASVLANKLDIPILLTMKDYVPASVKEEIEKLGANKIILIGEKNTISSKVEKELSSYKLERIGGPTRYETAVLVGERMKAILGNVDEAIVVDGTNFPDAIAMTSMGVEQSMPILLTPPKGLYKSTEKAIKDWKISKVTIGGGIKSVSSTVEESLKKLAKVDRISGKDRYETSVKVASQVYINPEHAVLASGEVFPDAIVGAPYAAKNRYPIVLSQKNIVPKVVKDYVEGYEIEEDTQDKTEETVEDGN